MWCVCAWGREKGGGGTDGWMDGRTDGWMEQNHIERVTKQWKENVVRVYGERRGGGIRT